MSARDAMPREGSPGRETLEQQIRQLEERLAFYEGFDQLIQDNVAHARELFRLAAQERESAAATNERLRNEAERRAVAARAELEVVAMELDRLAAAVDALSRRVAKALGAAGGGSASTEVEAAQPVAVVVHGVASAKTALSLQRFIASLPQVVDVSPREFAGGMLRLEARVHDSLGIDAFRSWHEASEFQVLTERPEVLEFSLASRAGSPALAR